jgi:serine/threonine protein kinase
MMNFTSKIIVIFTMSLSIVHQTHSSCIEGAMYDQYVASTERMKSYITSNVQSGTREEIKPLLGTRIKLLESGGFGNVYLHQQGKKEIAVKVMKPDPDSSESDTIKYLFYEMNANNCIKQKVAENPDLMAQFVTFNQVYQTQESGNIYMTMDKYSGDLFENIYETNPNGYERLSNNGKIAVVHKMFQLARSMIVLEKSGYIHRDLKPENIMMGPDSRPYIGDLGLLITKPEFSGVSGTPNYVDPNMLITSTGSVKSDVYSLGIIFYIMMGSFNKYNSMEKATNAQVAICKRNKNLCNANIVSFPEGFEFLNNMTSLNPDRRPKLHSVFLQLKTALNNLQNVPQTVIPKTKAVPQSKNQFIGLQKADQNQGNLVKQQVVNQSNQAHQPLRVRQPNQLNNMGNRPVYKAKRNEPSVEILNKMQIIKKNRGVEPVQHFIVNKNELQNLNSNAILRKYYKDRNNQNNFKIGMLLI